MKEIWEISRDFRKSRWVGVCPALQLMVEADTLPELRESIRAVEGGRLKSFIWAIDDFTHVRFVDSNQALNEPAPEAGKEE